MKQLTAITDLQFGSTGKGLLAGYLAQRMKPDCVVAAWGPNSGHTFIDADGAKMVNVALPNGIISPNLETVLLGPGSVIDPKLLLSEIDTYTKYVDGVDIMIHEHAAIVTEEHRQLEAFGTLAIGSTMKGVGEAVIQKIRRDRAKMNIAREMLRGTPLEGNVVSVEEYNTAIDDALHVMVEGSQGFSLGLNQGFYPYVTSRDCTLHQIMNDCAIPLDQLRTARVRTYGVARTYPIRVANRFRDGQQVGWSGPGYYDQREIEWRDIGIEPELTTVTRLPRRIFTFSLEQVRQAVRMNGTQGIFLNFCNYSQAVNKRSPESEARTIPELIHAIESLTQCPVMWTGWGPSVSQVEEA